MKANHKWLKDDLVSGLRKLGPDSVAPKLDGFPLFDEFFPDLADFWDLEKPLPFGFPDFLAYSTLSPPNLSTSLLPSFFSEVSLLLLFMLGVRLLGNPVVFKIEVSRVAIRLKS